MAGAAHFRTDTRPPARPLPPGATDCHFHVFGPRPQYPLRNTNHMYEPPDAFIAHAQAMHAALGVERAVLVQAALYRTDHSLLIDTLNGLPRDRYRGVGIVNDDVSDAELQRLHQAGVRGARFSFWKRMGLVPDLAMFRRSLERIGELGWHAKIFAPAADLAELYEELKPVRLPAVLDHMGFPDFGQPETQPGHREIFELLKRENWWILLSNGDRWSTQEPPWKDTIAHGRALYRAAPDRCIWATDWPHLNYAKTLIEDSQLVDLLDEYLPDEAARHAVLVGNPARLLGF